MTSLLLLKLILTPALLGLVSLAGRRWGPAVGGWLIGLPLTSAPVNLYLALDHGTAFAARAAQGTIIGILSLSAFGLAYTHLAGRHGWPPCLLGAWLAYGAVTLILQDVAVPLLLSAAGAVAGTSLALALLPAGAAHAALPPAARWEIPLRMIVGTVFVLVLTGMAGVAGPRLSGLLVTFPVFGSILAVFTQRFAGAPAAARMLRGMMTGGFAIAVFFTVIAVTLETWGVGPSFVTATGAALALHGASLWLLHRRPAPGHG
ncbi:MAG TPA: hypothetical protein VM536_14235 [Chloroflexia bacterium]|nr:hypothetical protein [Chloroflexia bacterium]